MEQLILKLQPNYISRLEREIARMQFAISKYEIKYNMTSDVFYQKIENGELGDDKDFVMWSGIYELLSDSKRQLSHLK